jgi:phage terminase large subunit-like protein
MLKVLNHLKFTPLKFPLPLVVAGLLTMAAPFRSLLESIATGKLIHDGNPVMRWMAGNTTAKEQNGMIAPSKQSASEKMDGITALTMALALAGESLCKRESVYDRRGIISLDDESVDPAAWRLKHNWVEISTSGGE